MDQIQSQIDQLSELDDQQISDLQDSIVGEFDTISDTEDGDITPQAVEQMTQLADYLDTVKDEAARREAQKAELASRAADAAARVKGDSSADAAVSDESEAVADDTSVDESADADAKQPVAASAAEEESTDEKAGSDAEQEARAEAEEQVPGADVTEDVKAEVAESTDPQAVTQPSHEGEASVETPTEAEAAVEETPAEAPTEEVTELSTEEETASEEQTTEGELATEAPAEAAIETPVEAEASNEDNTNEQSAQEEAPVTAAAEEAFEAPADRRPLDQDSKVAPVAITAGADIPGVTAGSKFEDMTDVADAMSTRIHSLRRVNGGDGEQHIVASLQSTYPEDRVLGPEREVNTVKIDGVVGPKALAASGGFAAPLEASYDLYSFGESDARPVRDALPRFQAERGGIRYLVSPVLSSYANAVGVWTNAMDIQAASNNGSGSDLHKNVLVVGSATEQQAFTDAITLQLQFGNLLTRAFPEIIARHNELALVQHARVAELNLLSKINAASTQITAAKQVGVARDLLVQLKKAVAAYRSRHRLDLNAQLRAIMPAWVRDAMAADLVLQMPGDDAVGTTPADIDRYLGTANVTITWSLDQNVFGAQAAGALSEFPASFTWFLFSEGAFVFLDGGTLDIGIVRDSGLVGTNDYRMFTETFEGLAKIGGESFAVTTTFGVTGEAAALTDTTPSA